jgi:hypothetical protein
MPKMDIPEAIQWFIDNKLTHQIHTSERKAFRACRRRWSWVYRDMYYPQVTAEPLEFGVAFHEAMEIFYEPRTWTQPLEIRTDLALVAFANRCKKQLKEYKKLNPDPDVTILESYKTRLELGLNMIRYYCNKMSPHYDKRWTPVEVEVSFEVPILHPKSGAQLWCKCSQCGKKWSKFTDKGTYEERYGNWIGLPVTYGGRLDALFKDELGRYWIADWKTTSRLLDEDAEASFLQLDDQIVSYMWALSVIGIEVAGFVYVEIKKAFPQPLKVLSRPYKGRLLSTDKTAMSTPDIALKSIQQHDPNGWQMGLYDEYLHWLRMEGPGFTQRHQIHKNVAEITNAGIVIATEALDMIGEPNVYPMPGRFSCNWCMFKQPCLGKNMGEDYIYTLDTMFERKTLHYYEEREASTE